MRKEFLINSIESLLNNQKEITIDNLLNEYKYSYYDAREHIEILIGLGYLEPISKKNSYKVIKKEDKKDDKETLFENSYPIEDNFVEKKFDENSISRLSLYQKDNKNKNLELFGEPFHVSDVLERILNSVEIVDEGAECGHIKFLHFCDEVKFGFVMRDGIMLITDLGYTMSFMDEKYELRSPEVRKCIMDIFENYDISTQLVEDKLYLIKSVTQKEDSCKGVSDLYSCMIMLKDMHIFFEEPKLV